MASISVSEIVQRILALGLLEQNQLQDVWINLGTQNVTSEVFAQALLRHSGLTKYQVERLQSGETTGFFYGDYKVLYPVGAGTFARVFRAIHTETKKDVAVKVLRQRFSTDPEAVDLFIREAELCIGFHHPNIVPTHSIHSEKNNIHYMVMDFVEGQTLREFVKVQKKIAPQIATRIITDVCRGLDYAFKRGQLHRDLKMSNVILSSGGKGILCDFGLAADENEKDPDHKNQRAIDYAALERTTHVQRDDKRSDIFFLGTMFFHMLTGIPPLAESRERAKRLDRTRFLALKPIEIVDPSIPIALALVVNKAMALDPEKRYQTPAAMLIDLENVAKKLATGTANIDPREGRSANTNAVSAARAAKKDTQLATVMIVEGDPEMQNVFRESLKRLNLRVLILSTAERALERFEDNDQTISCVLFNAQSLGSKAVLAFNQLGKNRLTADIPAILLLDESQTKWSAKAIRAKHRVAVGMPISMRRLLEVMLRLISNKNKASAPRTETSQGPAAEQTRSNTEDGGTTVAGLSTIASIDPQKSGALPAPGQTSIASKVNLASATDVGSEIRSGSEIFAVTSSQSHSQINAAQQSNVDLSGASESSDYVAYIQEETSASAVKTGTFSRTLFEEALNNAVDALVLRIQQGDDSDTGEQAVDEISGLTREEFLAGNPNKKKDGEYTGDNNGDDYSGDDYGSDDYGSDGYGYDNGYSGGQ